MNDMFPKKGGGDYSMGEDPNVEIFIIKNEKPVMMGCRMNFIK